MRSEALAAVLVIAGLVPMPVRSATISVEVGSSIQAAISAATGGDVITVAAGEFPEDIDFLGKAIAVIGSGPASVIRGTGLGSVVQFANGEGSDSVLDSFTITGGVADRGGGIYISGASPMIARNVITQNQARLQGSGLYITASNAQLYNNLITYNQTAGGDPHSVEIQDAAPQLINNTIVRGDSNGIILRGASPAIIMNNIIALNGSSGRGRGICDFSGGTAVMHYNLFFRNMLAAFLTDGTDYRRVRTVQSTAGLPRFTGNVDGSPRFQRPISRDPERTQVEDFIPRLRGRRGRAANAGNPEAQYNNLDGTRNHLGFTGGPFAAVP